jgi:hypothetical protein
MRLKFWKKQPRLRQQTDAEFLQWILLNYLDRDLIDYEVYENLSENCESVEELNWIMNKIEQYATV